MRTDNWDDSLDDFDYEHIDYAALDANVNGIIEAANKKSTGHAPSDVSDTIVWSEGSSISRPPSARINGMVSLLAIQPAHPTAPSSAVAVDFNEGMDCELAAAVVDKLKDSYPVVVRNAPASPISWDSRCCFAQLGIHPAAPVRVTDDAATVSTISFSDYLNKKPQVDRGAVLRVPTPRWTMPPFMELLDQGYLLGWAQSFHADPRPVEVDHEHCWAQCLPKYDLRTTTYHRYGYATQFQVRKGLVVFVIVVHKNRPSVEDRQNLIRVFHEMSNFDALDLNKPDTPFAGTYSIVLREGDALVLPPGSFYQTYASEDTIMTGNSFLHLSTLHLTEALRSFTNAYPPSCQHLDSPITIDIVLFTLMRLTAFLAISPQSQAIVLHKKCLEALTSMVIYGLTYTLTDFDHPVSAALKGLGHRLRDQKQFCEQPKNKGIKAYLQTRNEKTSTTASLAEAFGSGIDSITSAQSEHGEKLAIPFSHRVRRSMDVRVNLVYRLNKLSGPPDYLFVERAPWTDPGVVLDIPTILKDDLALA